MRVLKILGIALGALVLLIGGLFVGARFADGPLAMIPGGVFRSGEWVDEPIDDWSFAADEQEIELQLADDTTSRTTWILVRDGEAFIPASLTFPPGKRWHKRADADGRAILRIRGKRYPVTLERIEDDALARDLREIAAAKYSVGPPGGGGVWLFAVRSRAR